MHRSESGTWFRDTAHNCPPCRLLPTNWPVAPPRQVTKRWVDNDNWISKPTSRYFDLTPHRMSTSQLQSNWSIKSTGNLMVSHNRHALTNHSATNVPPCMPRNPPYREVSSIGASQDSSSRDYQVIINVLSFPSYFCTGRPFIARKIPRSWLFYRSFC